MVNSIHLLGNVGNDPEIVNLDNGTKIAKMSLATSETYKNKSGEKVTDTQWHNLVCFGKLSEIIEKYVNKGDKIYVDGKIKYDKWEKDGVKRTSTSIVINNMTMLGSKPQDNTPENNTNDQF